MSRSGALAPLRVPEFRAYFLAQTVNLAGSVMAPVALSFAVLDVSNSPSALGAVLAANTIPLVLFLLVGGVIADRLPRAVVVRAGNLAAGLIQGVVAVLVLTGEARLWMLIVLEALDGLVTAVVYPALQGMFPQLVPRGQLQQANALEAMMRNGLRVIGPTVAAAIVVAASPGWALAADAATWIASAALLLAVRLPARAPGEATTIFSDLREGWGLFRSTTWLWVIVVAFSVLNVIHAGGWLTLGPPHAKATIGVRDWGFVLSAEAVGLLVMTLVLLRVPLRRPLLVGMLAITLDGVPLIVLGAAPHLTSLLIACFLSGAGTSVFMLAWNLAMQENIEERMLSRAFSFDALGSLVAVPIGQLLYGPLGTVFGFRDVLVVSGVVYVAVALATLASESVRRLGRVT